ncbi:Xaa-Pro aminopeptidase [Brachionus plicatilis]|uniref:Xaa-Pro aminopeptidase n=1 Tax=Brachionus plicatilis TaxID=10195 RepID=A0A3M7P5X4_BRAPC|nr:Xaa-Pro aminopeptidase [Brachionus plicatilis]
MLNNYIIKHRKSFISSFIKYSSFTNDKSIKSCSNNQLVQELGQPTYWTHPHLFHTQDPSDFNKQVTPGISRQEFEQRRFNYVTNLTNYQMLYFSTKLSSSEKSKFGQMPLNQWIQNGFDLSTIDHNFIAVIPSSMTAHMAPDVPHIFKQNSDFMYLSGFNEPESVLVISRTGNERNSYKTAIFVKEKNPKKELWDGPCTGPENIKKLCGIQNAYPIQDFKQYLFSLVKESNPNKMISLWRYPTEHVVKQESGPNVLNEAVESALDFFVKECDSNRLIDMDALESLDDSATASYFNTSRYFVQLCRVNKSKPELELMKKACDISSQAFLNSIKISHPFINEHLIYSKFDFDCRIRGASYLGYIPVIAGGSRATTLHYIRNNQIIKNGELVLMDAGCQFNEYVSDITRTWPVNGKFSKEQKELYQACLNVQKHCIANCAPGISIQKLYYMMMRKLGDELSQIGLIDRNEHQSYVKSSEPETSPIPIAYLRKLTNFCAHDVGHYLGLDVHDCPEVSKHNDLEPNTVITIEPGIYIKPNDESVPFRYRGIGIRIEDDIVVTENGCEILSRNCPKEIEELEKLLNSQ